jgi:peptidyl-Asp metalloendopeptidase
LSEEHAIRAVVTGEMDVTAPNGELIRLKYARHVEHPDGNWTWIGRPEGAKPGIEAIVTFGEKAVFGTIPYGTQPLRLTTEAGRVWMMQTDGAQLAMLRNSGANPRTPDTVLPPRSRPHAASGATALETQALLAPAALSTATAASTANTVDLLIGYTSAFAQRLGGTSQAVTRLTHMVDISNQAFANSRIAAQVRLVGTKQVAYPDATSNKSALYELTGCDETSCNKPIPAALQILHAARDQYGADLVSLVRNFSDPENDGCGIAWVIGGEQTTITPSDEYAGMSVVSDSNGTGGVSFPDNGYVCRDETLAHELAHNMGSMHDRATAAGSSDSDNDGNLLDPEEYGRSPYSFGYRVNGAASFLTVMAYRESGTSQVQNRIFSNPQMSTCGPSPGSQIYPCGVANQADNARSLRESIPVIASFRPSMAGMADMAAPDFDGDGRSDVFWRNGSTGADSIWRSANSAAPLAVASAKTIWKLAGIGDLDGDGTSDVLWRNTADGRNTAWRSGSAASQLAIKTVSSQAWKVAALADFNGDGLADILWRNADSGTNAVWKSGNASTQQPIAAVTNLDWAVAGAGDFDGDGRADILWRNGRTGANSIWRSGNASTQRSMASVTNLAWRAAGSGDFDGDGKDDVLWHNDGTGASSIWRSAIASTPLAVSPLKDTRWRVAAVADYNGDGRSDIFWRHSGNGTNTIWRSANASTPQAVSTVPSLSWSVAR